MNLGVIIDDEMEITKAFISKTFQTFSDGKVPTFINSGASDTMFVSRADFSAYKLTPPRSGDSAKAVDGNFDIVGEGTVVDVQLTSLTPGNSYFARLEHAYTADTIRSLVTPYFNLHTTRDLQHLSQHIIKHRSIIYSTMPGLYNS